MQKYESMVVISTKQDEEAIKGLVEKFTSLIEANGTMVSVEEWGKRRLAQTSPHDPREGRAFSIVIECLWHLNRRFRSTLCFQKF